MNNSASHPVDSLLEGEMDIDPQLGDILEDYLTALERGESPDRETFLAAHPQHADQLAKYLPWVELLYEAKPRNPGANPPMPNRLGDFRIVGELGRGGMGIVYQAEQLSLQRPVALKVLPFASMLDERQLARFKNEALAAAQLHHPNIVPVFAVGCEQGLHFYVMQLIEGVTLEQLIDDAGGASDQAPVRDSTVRLADAKTNPNAGGTMARFRQFAQWTIQAAEALDHAHGQGIVHRDIKPSNLMICENRDLWVTDFGLARTQHDASVTLSGELLGTLRYMSPEQLRSKSGFVDHRTDIYSLGLTLYELIANRPAFEGPTQHELIRQIESDEPRSLTRIDPRVPRDLDSIVSKAIAKTPEARYASAREMADDLRCFLEGRPTVARPPSWRDHCEKWVRRHARLVASAGLALALVMVCAVVSAVLVWRARGETQRALSLARDNHQRAEAHLQDARHVVDDLFTGVAMNLAEIPGAEPVRHELLNKALAYYQQFAEQSASNPAIRAEKAAAYYRCGQIREQLGDDPGAQTAYENARQLWQTLRTPAGDEQLRPLALCENNLGLIAFRAGRNAKAESHLRTALARQRELVSRRPDDTEARRDLALGNANLGMVLAASGRSEEARNCLQSALDLQTSDQSLSPSSRGDLASTYNQLGYLLSSSSLVEAETAYRRAAEAFEQLAEDQPQILRWRAELATTLNNLAAVAVHADRPDEAETYYQRAIEIRQRLAERAPQVIAYARDLAVSQNNLGYLLSRQNQHEEATQQFLAAQANLLRLARAHEDSPELASRLGAVCNNLGLNLESQGHPDRAQAAFEEAIAWQNRALQRSPTWQQAQTYLEAHTANLQRVLAATARGAVGGDAVNASGSLSGQGSDAAAITPRDIVPMTSAESAPSPNGLLDSPETVSSQE